MSTKGKAKHGRNRTSWEHAAVLGEWTATLVQLTQLIISLLH